MWTLVLGCARVGDAVVRHAPHDVDDPSEQDLPIAPAPTGSEPTEQPGSETDTGAPYGGVEVCYLGADGDGSTCLPAVVLPTDDPDYAYPEPLYGSAQYAAPFRALDLLDLSESTSLAPNFALGEFAAAWKGRYAVVMPRLVDVLQEARDVLGPVVVNSGYRSPAYNASVGGATWSRHQYGDGVDIAAIGEDLDTVAATCESLGAAYIGWYEAHIHCDWRDDPMDPVFYGSRAAGGAAPMPEHAAWVVWQGDLLTAPAEGWDEGEPLREWAAWDDAGTWLAEGVGASWTAPEGASRVVVVVGRAVTVEARR